MPIILRNLPFFDAKTIALVQGHPIAIKADQIIVWVGIAESEQLEFDRRRPFFPAVLDTGLSHNFSIQEQHLIDWAGLDPRYLRNCGYTRVHAERLPLLDADVWILPNKPGERDRFIDELPFCLELDSGIAVYPKAMMQAPRLPLLGASRIANSEPPLDHRLSAAPGQVANRSAILVLLTTWEGSER